MFPSKPFSYWFKIIRRYSIENINQSLLTKLPPTIFVVIENTLLTFDSYDLFDIECVFQSKFQLIYVSLSGQVPINVADQSTRSVESRLCECSPICVALGAISHCDSRSKPVCPQKSVFITFLTHYIIAE